MPFSYLTSAGLVQLFVDLHDNLIIFNLHSFLYLLQVQSSKMYQHREGTDSGGLGQAGTAVEKTLTNLWVQHSLKHLFMTSFPCSEKSDHYHLELLTELMRNHQWHSDDFCGFSSLMLFFPACLASSRSSLGAPKEVFLTLSWLQ